VDKQNRLPAFCQCLRSNVGSRGCWRWAPRGQRCNAASAQVRRTHVGLSKTADSKKQTGHCALSFMYSVMACHLVIHIRVVALKNETNTGATKSPIVFVNFPAESHRGVDTVVCIGFESSTSRSNFYSATQNHRRRGANRCERTVGILFSNSKMPGKRPI
jgi:hypothetical protein